MSDPERYLNVATLEDEIAYRPEALGVDDEVGDGEDVSDWEQLLQRFLDEESDRIEGPNYADTRFVPTTTTATLYGDTAAVGDDLLLRERPVRSVTSIDADGTALDVDTDVRVRETHVQLLEAAPLTSWPDGPITVEWEYGYEEPPGEVIDALVRLVRSRLDRIQTDGLESESLPSGQSASFRPPEEIRADVRRTVAQYEPDSYHSGAMVI
jgi:hypothetical protein